MIELQVHDIAKEERRLKYCCVRGSSALNSLSGTDAFRMSIVRWEHISQGMYVYNDHAQ